MKYLIISTHPNPESFNNAITTSVIEELQKNSKKFDVRDLYQINFDPVLKLEDLQAMVNGSCLENVRREREYIKSAGILIFIFPVYMFNMPAMLKGYFDRVLSLGFGYKVENNKTVPLLKDKKALIFSTTYSSKEFGEEIDLFKSVNKTIGFLLEWGCGIEVLEHKFFTSVPVVTDGDRKKMLEEVKEIIRSHLM